MLRLLIPEILVDTGEGWLHSCTANLKQLEGGGPETS